MCTQKGVKEFLDVMTHNNGAFKEGNVIEREKERIRKEALADYVKSLVKTNKNSEERSKDDATISKQGKSSRGFSQIGQNLDPRMQKILEYRE